MVPAKAPKEVVDTLHKAAVAALKRPDVARRLHDLGYIPVGNRPEDGRVHQIRNR
jgi:tripartite-type tricarboxylate transporter receptor subunit TctC